MPLDLDARLKRMSDPVRDVKKREPPDKSREAPDQKKEPPNISTTKHEEKQSRNRSRENNAKTLGESPKSALDASGGRSSKNKESQSPKRSRWNLNESNQVTTTLTCLLVLNHWRPS